MAASRAALEARARQIARKYGIPEAGFLAQIGMESGWNPSARSPAGALGIAQFMPGTAKSIGVNPLDPISSLEGMGKHMSTLRKNLGSWDLALAGYNAGGGAVQKYGGVPPYKETQNYVSKLGPYFKGGAQTPSSGRTVSSGGAMDPQAQLQAAAPHVDAQALLSLLQRTSQDTLKGKAPGPDYMRALAGIIANARINPQAEQMGSGAAQTGRSVGAAATMSNGGIFGNIKAKLIGDEAAHHARAIGNWQSDRALDLAVKYGTPVYAVADGVIGRRFGALNSRDPKMQGLRLNLEGTSIGNFYYAHLSRFANGIKPGTRVKKGQLLGYTGKANGVDHLHIGADRANLRQLLGY